jgi:phosphoribosylformylglycinamidine (FGAM) synthase PurS component
VELTVEAPDEDKARVVLERLAGELLSNPLIEVFGIEAIGVPLAAVGIDAAGEG